MKTQKQTLLDFLKFVLEHKLPKLIRHMTLQQLSNLCCSFLPKMENSELLAERGQAIMVIGVIEQELKRRYPTNIMLQDTNFSKPNEVAKVLDRLGGLYS